MLGLRDQRVDDVGAVSVRRVDVVHVSVNSSAQDAKRLGLVPGRTEDVRTRELHGVEAHPVHRVRPEGRRAAKGHYKLLIAPPSTGTIVPLTNEAAGDSRNAATRPNSSGRP